MRYPKSIKPSNTINRIVKGGKKKIMGTVKKAIPKKIQAELNKVIGMLPKNPKNIFAKLNKVKKKLAVMKPKKK